MVISLTRLSLSRNLLNNMTNKITAYLTRLFCRHRYKLIYPKKYYLHCPYYECDKCGKFKAKVD